MSVKLKILHDIKARNPTELREFNNRKIQRKAKRTKRVYRYLHRHRTFKRLIGGLIAYIFIMVIFITLIFFYIG